MIHAPHACDKISSSLLGLRVFSSAACLIQAVVVVSISPLWVEFSSPLLGLSFFMYVVCFFMVPLLREAYKDPVFDPGGNEAGILNNSDATWLSTPAILLLILVLGFPVVGGSPSNQLVLKLRPVALSIVEVENMPFRIGSSISSGAMVGAPLTIVMVRLTFCCLVLCSNGKRLGFSCGSCIEMIVRVVLAVVPWVMPEFHTFDPDGSGRGFPFMVSFSVAFVILMVALSSSLNHIWNSLSPAKKNVGWCFIWSEFDTGGDRILPLTVKFNKSPLPMVPVYSWLINSHHGNSDSKVKDVISDPLSERDFKVDFISFDHWCDAVKIGKLIIDDVHGTYNNTIAQRIFAFGTVATQEYEKSFGSKCKIFWRHALESSQLGVSTWVFKSFGLFTNYVFTDILRSMASIIIVKIKSTCYWLVLLLFCALSYSGYRGNNLYCMVSTAWLNDIILLACYCGIILVSWAGEAAGYTKASWFNQALGLGKQGHISFHEYWLLMEVGNEYEARFVQAPRFVHDPGGVHGDWLHWGFVKLLLCIIVIMFLLSTVFILGVCWHELMLVSQEPVPLMLIISLHSLVSQGFSDIILVESLSPVSTRVAATFVVVLFPTFLPWFWFLWFGVGFLSYWPCLMSFMIFSL